MKITQWPTEKAVPYDRNPRKNEEAVAKVARSLEEFGWQQPIVVDGAGVVIVGHTRLLAAKRLGLKTIPVLVAKGLTPERVKAYRLADNRTHEEAEWDPELLALELGELKEAGYELELTGFDEDEIAKALAEENGNDGADFQITPIYQVLIECGTEAEQLKILTKLQKDGVPCRALLA